MRRSPSIVPNADDRDVYLVLDDFGRRGRSWREVALAHEGPMPHPKEDQPQ